MGSFNTTCFASNQTIAPGDACRVILLRQQHGYQPVALTRGEEAQAAYGITSSTCYADSFWQPKGNFIQAVYDDYGQVKLSFDARTRGQLLGLFQYLLSEGWHSAQGENSCHDVPFDLPAFLAEKAPGMASLFNRGEVPWQDGQLDEELAACWDYVWDVVREHRLFGGHYGGPRPLQFALLHEHAYQALVAMTARSTGWDGTSYEPESYLRHAIAGAQKECQSDPADRDNAEMDLAMRAMTLGSALREALARGAGSSSLDTTLSLGISRLARAHVKGELSEDELVARCKPALEDCYAIGGLNALNLRFAPQIYAPQDYSNGIGQAYAAFVAQVSCQVTRTRNEECYGDFQRYVTYVTDSARAALLPGAMNGVDAALDEVATELVKGEVRITFSCTLEHDRLRQVLRNAGLADMAAVLMRYLPDVHDGPGAADS